MGDLSQRYGDSTSPTIVLAVNNKLPLVPLAKYLFDSDDLPWMWPLPPWASPRHHALRHLRRVARRKLRSELIERIGWPRMLSQILAWPLVSTLKAAIAVKDHPDSLPAKLSQFGAYCWLQWAHNIHINDQQELLLTIPERRKQALGWMQSRENQALITLTTERLTGYPDVFEKRGFARFCTEFNLPAPPLLAAGKGTQSSISSSWPKTDLILKPSDLAWGKGIEVLYFQKSSSTWRGENDITLNATNISEYASNQYNSGPWVLQPWIKNAASWSHLTPGALATVRVNTGRLGRGASPLVMDARLQLPQQRAIIDNSRAGGISIPLDPQTGRLSKGHTHIQSFQEYTAHPDTGAIFAGEILPDFKKILWLALQAHRMAGEWTTIAWDITLTEDGPQMIEANPNWRILPGIPISESPYIEVMQKALNIT